jgi:hypothetical protein
MILQQMRGFLPGMILCGVGILLAGVEPYIPFVEA